MCCGKQTLPSSLNRRERLHFTLDDSCSMNNGLQKLTSGPDEGGRTTESQLHGAITENIDSLPAKIPLIRVSAKCASHGAAGRRSAGEKMKAPLGDRVSFSPPESSLFRHCDAAPVFV